MKKIFLILALVAVTATIASGKIRRRQMSIFQASVPETETLAPENMEFVYNYRCCVDTTGSLSENYDSDNMLLQIDRTVSQSSQATEPYGRFHPHALPLRSRLQTPP